MEDAFKSIRELDHQIAMNECTSVSEASGVRVVVLSTELDVGDPTQRERNEEKKEKKSVYQFTYRVRVENHSSRDVQLMGRHWVIEDKNGHLEVVKKFQPGVVGYTPVLTPGDVFVYGSGVRVRTEGGEMRGAFQFYKHDGEMFEVPVAPFKLIANQEDRI